MNKYLLSLLIALPISFSGMSQETSPAQLSNSADISSEYMTDEQKQSSEATLANAHNGMADIIEVEDRVSLKTSFIKGNKELPQVLYIVPWQTIKQTEKKPENIVLHSLYGDVFQPLPPQNNN